MGEPQSRTYHLAPPDGGGAGYRCADCERQIPPGYPFVHNRRQPSDELMQIGGIPVLDALCVYCDPGPRQPA